MHLSLNIAFDKVGIDHQNAQLYVRTCLAKVFFESDGYVRESTDVHRRNSAGNLFTILSKSAQRLLSNLH